eukprot:COSAG02_NODE_2924_length_7735_cov_4.298324_10_plen_36_part_00
MPAGNKRRVPLAATDGPQFPRDRLHERERQGWGVP